MSVTQTVAETNDFAIPVAKRQRVNGEAKVSSVPRGSRIFSPFRVCGLIWPASFGNVHSNMNTDLGACLPNRRPFHFCTPWEDDFPGHHICGPQPASVRSPKGLELGLSQSPTDSRGHHCNMRIQRSSAGRVGRKAGTW